MLEALLGPVQLRLLRSSPPGQLGRRPCGSRDSHMRFGPLNLPSGGTGVTCRWRRTYPLGGLRGSDDDTLWLTCLGSTYRTDIAEIYDTYIGNVMG